MVNRVVRVTPARKNKIAFFDFVNYCFLLLLLLLLFCWSFCLVLLLACVVLMDFKVDTHPAGAKATVRLLAWTRQDLQLPMIKVQTPKKFKLEAQQHYFQHFS